MATNLQIPPALKKRAAQIKVLLMDVDGTMTDGGVSLLSQTEEIALEIKTFDAHDGQGLTLAHTAGLRTGCITGRQSSALLRRAHEMYMEFIYMKQPLKMPAYEEIVEKTRMPESAVAYIGDDLPGIPGNRRPRYATPAQHRRFDGEKAILVVVSPAAPQAVPNRRIRRGSGWLRFPPSRMIRRSR